MPEPAGVKRACDACHRRKVKCIGDGNMPCRNCSQAGLTCTYNAVPQKKGPKGSRAKVISELKETQQRRPQLTSPTSQSGFSFGSPPSSPSSSRSLGVLSPALVKRCVDYYFAHLYATQPILHRQRVEQTIVDMDHAGEAYCMIHALCAYVLIQPSVEIPSELMIDSMTGPPGKVATANLLLDEVGRARKNFNYIENPTYLCVSTSFFLFGSYFCLDKHNLAWFHLREATTLSHIMQMHDESTYQIGDYIEASRKRRLYWLLFVTERAHALQRRRPLTLHATIELPRVDEDPAEAIELTGFIHLVNLFRPFDDTFVGLWNKARVGCTTAWLAKLQQQLCEALPVYLQGTDSQIIDLHISQQWLRTMVWQLSISQGFLSSTAEHHALTFHYPIEISRDLGQMASQFTQEAIEIHGVGLVEKLFDIACTLVDVLACVPIKSSPYEFGPRDYLDQIVTLISHIRGGQQRYLPLIMSKLDEVLPSMPPMHQGMPPLVPQLSPSDIQKSSLSDGTSYSHATSPYGSPPSQVGLQAQMDYPVIAEAFSPQAMTGQHDDVAYSEMSSGAAPISSGLYPGRIMGGYPG